MRPYKDVSSDIQQSDAHFPVNRHILIVDDQEDIRLFLSDRLANLGFLTSAAPNGREGLALLQQHSYCGILLDLEMPVMNGLGMLRELRQESNTIPVIVMSGDHTRTTMIQAIEAGARDFLTKPFSDVILKYKCLRLFT